jgi:hypothetical protein
MQLLLKRSQKTASLIGKTILFCTDIRAEYTEEERANINRYNLGGDVIYNSEASKRHMARMESQMDSGGMGILKGLGSAILSNMSLNITIASLQRGQHIECKDLSELLAAEEAVIEACKGLKAFLAAAATFDGREEVIDLDEHVA